MSTFYKDMAQQASLMLQPFFLNQYPFTKTAVTSLVMVRFDCFHLSVVANNWGHNFHPQLLDHMRVHVHEFRVNLRVKVQQIISLKLYSQKLFYDDGNPPHTISTAINGEESPSPVSSVGRA